MIHLKDKILKECHNLEKLVTKINQTLDLINVMKILTPICKFF